MTNREVAEAYISHCRYGETVSASSQNLHFCDNLLVSYSTPVIKYEDGVFTATKHKYSQTTSKHINLACSLIPNDILQYVEKPIAEPGTYPKLH